MPYLLCSRQEGIDIAETSQAVDEGGGGVEVCGFDLFKAVCTRFSLQPSLPSFGGRETREDTACFSFEPCIS